MKSLIWVFQHFLFSGKKSFKDVLANRYCASSSAHKDVKLLRGYNDFYGLISLCFWFDTNAQLINVKKLQRKQKCSKGNNVSVNSKPDHPPGGGGIRMFSLPGGSGFRPVFFALGSGFWIREIFCSFERKMQELLGFHCISTSLEVFDDSFLFLLFSF